MYPWILSRTGTVHGYMCTYPSWIYTWEVWSICAVVVVIVLCAVCHCRHCHILPHVSLCCVSSLCRVPCTVVVMTLWHLPSVSHCCCHGVMHCACCCCCCCDAVVLAIRVMSPSLFLPAVIIVIVMPWHSPSVSHHRHCAMCHALLL